MTELSANSCLTLTVIFIWIRLRTLTFQSTFIMSVPVSNCNNPHTCIFILLEKCFSFLLFILTHSYLSYTTLVAD